MLRLVLFYLYLVFLFYFFLPWRPVRYLQMNFGPGKLKNFKNAQKKDSFALAHGGRDEE